MQYINDPRYPPGDDESMATRRLAPRKANVEFKGAAVESTKNYKKQQALQVFTLKNIRVGEKLFVYYDAKYSFE